MLRSVQGIVCCLMFAAFGCSQAIASEKFELRDGDRVVLLGSTLIERGQSYGYLETLLTSRFADRKIVFRNLGWSGDNVFGHARAGFGAPAEGYKQLIEQVSAVRPTVILVAYGGNEAFEGAAKLPEFVDGLNRLLDDLSAIKETSASRPRIVLLTPPPMENLGPPLPDPREHNQALREYGQAIGRVAERRDLPLIDLFDLLEGTGSQTGPLTDNGLHWTAYGYWHASRVMAQALGVPLEANRVTIDVPSKTGQVDRGKLSELEITPTSVHFQKQDAWLPCPAAPTVPDGAVQDRPATTLVVSGLPPGDYELTIDGQPVAKANADAWRQGVALTRGPDLDQVESLRQAIVDKNRLFFYRWRPQNETYLFGFRKHEQGQNAKEIAQFDPLVAEQETRIHELAQPRARAYKLLKQ